MLPSEKRDTRIEVGFEGRINLCHPDAGLVQREEVADEVTEVDASIHHTHMHALSCIYARYCMCSKV